MPDRLARHLPARRRRAHVNARLDARQIDRAARVGARPGTFESGTLFAAVDRLLALGRADALLALEPLCTDVQFDQRVWRQIARYFSEAPDRALRSLDRFADAPGMNGFRRMCGPAWAMFLRRYHRDAGTTGATPPTIVQFWDAAEPPADVAREMAAWRRLAGDRYRRFDDDTARAFIAAHYGARDAQIFDGAGHPAIKADFFRLCYLHAEGGFYVDADARMRPDFARVWPMMAGRLVLWFLTERAEGHFTNLCMAAPAGHPLIASCLDIARDRLSRTPEAHVYALAGPSVLTEAAIALEAEGGLDDLALMGSCFVKTHVLSQIPAAYKADRRNWRTWQADRERAAA